jgi:hypothetical protein
VGGCDLRTAGRADCSASIKSAVAPTLGTLGMSLRGIEILESFDCRRFNGISGAKLSEHGHAKTSCPLIVASLLVLNAGSGHILGLIALPVQTPLY